MGLVLPNSRRGWLAALVVGSGLVAGIVWLSLPPRFDSRQAYLTRVESDLKSLATLQETYRDRHGAYTDDLGALGFAPGVGVRVQVEIAPAGWTAWATHDALGDDEGCSIYGGSGRQPESAPGRPTEPGVVDCRS